MPMTALQLRAIRYYLQHRDHAPTWKEFFRRCVRPWLIGATIVAAIGYLCIDLEWPMLGYLLAGMLVGAALREIRQQYHAIRAWPGIAAIVNWERAEAIIAASIDDPDNSPVNGRW